MIMAHMYNQPMALAIDSCFSSTTGAAPISLCDNYSSTGSSHSDVDEDGDDGNLVNQSVPFPWKLHEMLDIAEKENFTNIVSWLPDHKSFKVYQTETFVRDIMPKYFRQTKYKSFQRQLNMWGFERLLSGPSKGGYLHQHFIRGQPALCRYMKRLKIKGTGNKKPVPSPFKPSSASPKAKIASTRLSPGHVLSQATILDHNQLKFPVEVSQPTVTTSIRNSPPFVSNTGEHNQAMSSSDMNDMMARSFSNTITRSRSDVDLFDEDTLSSVLSSVFENPRSMESVPSDGDCVIFEGMQFFFVEDDVHHQSPSHATRRLSIELSRGAVGAGKRRLSLVGVQRATSTPFASLEPTAFSLDGSGYGQLSENFSNQSPARQRPARRFSLQRNGTSSASGYVLKQIVEI